MATATQLMPSPSGLKSMSAFSPYTDSPSSPANFAQVFSSNRCAARASAELCPSSAVLMDSPRSSNTSDHLQPPPSPYPATVDPSPVDSNGTNHTDHTEIEDDAQVNELANDFAADVQSPATDDIVSPASQDSHAKQWQQPFKLDTTVPVRTRADSDEAPPSVIHAPAHFKQFVCALPLRPRYIAADSLSQNRTSTSTASSNVNPSESTAVESPSTPEANMLPDVDDKVRLVPPLCRAGDSS